MKKRLFALLLMFILFCQTCAVAEKGLLPKAEDLFATVLPSFDGAILADTGEREKREDGSTQVVYTGVTEEEFDAWSVYIEQKKCSVVSYGMQDDVFSAVLEKDGKSFSFSYDHKTGVMMLLYPKGTKEEALDLEDEIAKKVEKQAMLEAFHTVGGIVSYGHYEQDNDPENGQEPIEWIVLDVKDEKALLLSKQLLDVIPYNSEGNDITWEKCSLRAWLNRDFLNDAFTPEEAEIILVTDVDNSKEQGFRAYDTEGGNDTEDRLFLLSYKEAFEQYFHNENERKCVPTDFAYARGAGTTTGYKTNGNKTGWWWLRSPGKYQSIPTIVLYVGKETDYYAVFGNRGCVRPAFWLDLNAL